MKSHLVECNQPTLDSGLCDYELLTLRYPAITMPDD